MDQRTKVWTRMHVLPREAKGGTPDSLVCGAPPQGDPAVPAARGPARRQATHPRPPAVRRQAAAARPCAPSTAAGRHLVHEGPPERVRLGHVRPERLEHLPNGGQREPRVDAEREHVRRCCSEHVLSCSRERLERLRFTACSAGQRLRDSRSGCSSHVTGVTRHTSQASHVTRHRRHTSHVTRHRRHTSQAARPAHPKRAGATRAPADSPP